ncbi:mechanosensitive ion channel family protein [Salinicola avicenniae]|uniref:mechanosensitive ion channel family protein n=1 Tax=Salinicola avicenniae TaxID=2916836 RepID=UPI002073DFB3|nr:MULTISPECIES: mechanosensitive ion channel domain-containing protein [unclassified Salinicola]
MNATRINALISGGIDALPFWMMAAVIIGATALAHAALKYLHYRLRRLNDSRLHLLSATAKAVHPPLVGALWVYGLFGAAHYLIPTDVQGHALILTAAHFFAALLGVWLLIRVCRRLVEVMDRWGDGRTTMLERFLVPFMARCLAALIPIFVLFSIFPVFVTSASLDTALHNLTSLILIGSIAGVLIHGVNISERALSERYRFDVEENEDAVARKVHTQITVLRKLINFVIVILALASMLMVFEKVRQLGASILASAGILGVVLGFAAQKVLGNLIAGIQIALTQPIQLNDSVIVEGEWGWVEELTLTYAVVRTWDWRRVVLPITYFVDHPFENWTRRDKDLIGVVILYVDYQLPMAPLRAECQRIAEASPFWTGRVCKVQMLEMTDRNKQLRVLISSSGGPNTFDLRCEIREGLIDFICQHYPQHLPTVRLDLPQRDGGNLPQPPLAESLTDDAESQADDATSPTEDDRQMANGVTAGEARVKHG